MDESAGQVLPALRNPTPTAGEGFGGDLGALPPEQAACFTDPAFLVALPKTVGPIEDAFVDATKLAGFVAVGFVLVGVFLSLLLPKMPEHPAEDPELVLAETIEGIASVV